MKYFLVLVVGLLLLLKILSLWGEPSHKKYSEVQSIAKETLKDLCPLIRPGVSEKWIASKAREILNEKGVSKFWYYDTAALVLVGERTLLSVSGKDYLPSETTFVQEGDLVTVDLSPVLSGAWGDYARSFVVTQEKTFLDEAPSTEEELSLGIEVERRLHKEFLEFASPSHTFEDLYRHFNQRIESLGFKNLDFKGNLGHSIAKDLEKRVYMEEGNQRKLSEVSYFTFEPHIQNKQGGPGFKKENIYYFNESRKLETL